MVFCEIDSIFYFDDTHLRMQLLAKLKSLAHELKSCLSFTNSYTCANISLCVYVYVYL